MNAETLHPEGRRLKTWKEIAAFFGCDERTVKRWEEARGLPVHRLPNGTRSAVFAYEAELRAWLHAEKPAAGDSNLADKAGDSDVIDATNSRSWFPKWLIGILSLVGAAAALAVLWFVSAPISSVRHNPPDTEAEKFYQAGVYGWQSRTPAGLTQAVDDFTQAIVHDPQYAKAYAGLANCYNLLRAYTAMPDDYAFPRAKAAAERAIALDPSLADAHAALGFTDLYWSHDMGGAEREFKTSLRLAPHNATVHHWYAVYLMMLRRFPQALAEIDKAQKLDTASAPIRAAKGLILFFAGRTEEAAELLHQLEETQPKLASPHLYLTAVAQQQGDDAAFVREWSAYADSVKDPEERAIVAASRRGLETGGHAAMLQAGLSMREKQFSQGKGSAYALAEAHAQLGHTDESLHYLRLSIQRRESGIVSMNVEPDFRRLHSLPAFQQLLHQIGM